MNHLPKQMQMELECDSILSELEKECEGEEDLCSSATEQIKSVGVKSDENGETGERKGSLNEVLWTSVRCQWLPAP